MNASRNPGRVIITYGRSLMALVIARSLAEQGVEVIACDDVGMTVCSFSRHVQETFTVAPWDREPEQFLKDLEAAVLEYAPTDGRPYVLMPVFREIDLIARNRARFEPAIKVAAPAIKSVELVTPKHKLAALAEAEGLDVPHTWVANSEAALEATLPKLTYPVIVKPCDGAGGRGVCKADDADDTRAKVTELGFDPPTLIQECIEGEDYCVPILARKGEIQAIMAYRNVTTFPREAGAGAVRETVDAEPFRAAAEELAAATDWDGIAQLDFRWSGNAKDAPKLIEVNARFWAGVFHSIESGVDFPLLLYRQTIGEPLDDVDSEAEVGATTKTSGAWLLAAIEDIAASDPHFNAAADAWREAKRDAKSGDLITAMEKAGRAITQTFTIKDALRELRHTMRDLKDAPSELSEAKDPMVGLGALFVLSSLVRHGKLPAEVTYDAETGDTPQAPPAMHKRPVIGITKPERGDALAVFAMKMAVRLAGGEPVEVTARAPRDPHTVDGLIFGGGSDVYPKRYQGTPKEGYRYDLARGDMEASWALAARRHDLPVLGVCRGAQMLNVLAGGTLHADLSEFKHGRAANALRRFFQRFPVKVRATSRLAKTTQCAKIMRVNAIHSQAIDRLGAGLKVSAREPNGVIQGIEDPARRYWLGVQFHPEFLIYRAPFRRLFKTLVEQARVRAEERHAEALKRYEADQPAVEGDGATSEQRTKVNAP